MCQTVTCLIVMAMAAATLGDQEIVLRLDFDSPEQWAVMEGQVGRPDSGHAGTTALLVEKASPAGSAVRQIRLPAQRLAVGLVTVSATARQALGRVHAD